MDFIFIVICGVYFFEATFSNCIHFDINVVNVNSNIQCCVGFTHTLEVNSVEQMKLVEKRAADGTRRENVE